MTIYVLLGFILIIFFILEQRVSLEKKRFILFVGVFLLFIVAALRGVSVGADTDQYYYGYEQLFTTPFNQIFTVKIWDISYKYTFDWEMGYRLYTKLLGMITQIDSGQIMTAFSSLIYCGFLYKFLRSKSSSPILSLFLCVSLGFYQTALNMMPNAIVTMIIYYFFKDLNINNKKFIVVIIILSFFHTSALFYLFLIPLDRYNLSLKKISFLLIGLIVLIFCFDKISYYLIYIVPERYSYFLTQVEGRYIVKPEQIFVWGFHIALLFFVIVFMKLCRCNFNINEYVNTITFKMFFLETVFYLFTIRISGFSRMAFLFSPYIIITIPDLINKIKIKQNRKLLTVFIILICFFQYIFRLLYNNIGSTLPYNIFF